MKLAVFAFSRRGCQTAARIVAGFPGAEVAAYAPESQLRPGFLPVGKPRREFYGQQFHSCDALIFVGACGIAVRLIAPHVQDKGHDPAVLCVDELGRFVISLLSGHIGGANRLTQSLAELLGATPVITTATDINGRFSVDAWATRQGLIIDDLKQAKAVSAAILEGEVPICCPLNVVGDFPAGTRPGSSGALGIYIGYQRAQPFEQTLRLIPKVLHLGIGCRRGISKAAVADAVSQVLEAQGLEPRAVKCAASIDLKAGEAGLLDFCRESAIPLSFYTAEELRAVPGTFTPSGFVQQVTGVDNVCERAALLGAETLLVRKTGINGVTVAVAAERTEIRFG